MGKNACRIRKKGDGGAALDRLAEGTIWVNTQIKTDNEHKTFQVASNELCCLVWLVTRGRCTEEELGQFSYELLSFFLNFNCMVDGCPGALPLQCLSHSQRTQLAQVTDSSHKVHARLNIVSNFINVLLRPLLVSAPSLPPKKIMSWLFKMMQINVHIQMQSWEERKSSQKETIGCQGMIFTSLEPAWSSSWHQTPSSCLYTNCDSWIVWREKKNQC